jgi:hypothetical protein
VGVQDGKSKDENVDTYKNRGGNDMLGRCGVGGRLYPPTGGKTVLEIRRNDFLALGRRDAYGQRESGGQYALLAARLYEARAVLDMARIENSSVARRRLVNYRIGHW